MNKVLLALGAPLWMLLLIAFFAVLISLAAAVWAVFVSFAACAVAGAAGGNIFVFGGHWVAGIAMAGAAFFCAGMAVVTFFACREVSKGIFWVMRKIFLGVIRCFAGGKSA